MSQSQDLHHQRENKKRGSRYRKINGVVQSGDNTIAIATGVRCPRPDKVRYLSRREARRARKRTHYGGRPTDVHSYRCVCGYWHLGGGDEALKIKRREA